MKLLINATFAGCNIKKDSVVDVKFKFPASELASAVQTVTMLNTNISAKVKIDGEVVKVGSGLSMTRLMFDGDGEATLILTGDTDCIEVESMAPMVQKSVILRMVASSTQNADAEESA